MKTLKKILAVVLALALVLGLAACGEAKIEDKELELTPEVDLEGYLAESDKLYGDQLGEFKTAYEAAKAEVANVSLRNVLMAIAEAKLLESAVYVPGTSKGGNYAIGRVAYGTVSPCLWGLDGERYHQAIVVNGDPLLKEEREEMKAKYAELKGTGTYEAWVKDYLKGKGYTLNSTYDIGYSSEPRTWDLLATYRAADSEAILNTVDMLYEYDIENVQRPALALSHTVSEDGKVYTFTLRQGVNWVDYQGRVIAELTADDFVAGLQHLLDVKGGLEGLAGAAGANIKNADAYTAGDITDFAEVGVKAVDKYTLEYTLEEANPFFITMLSYNPMAPLCRTYYESMGGKFGAEFDSSAESYKYGLTSESIPSCGAYVVTSHTDNNSIVFESYPGYWNYDNINIKKIVWHYNDGKDATKAYNDMKAGVLAASGLNDSALELAKKDGWFDKYGYTTGTDATSYGTFMNINRQYFADFNDPTTVVTAQTYKQSVYTGKAMQNVHFRRALAFSLDRAAYNAQTVGDELKLVSLINTYTPGNFVQTSEDVTVKINGKDTTFPAGTYYGAVLQAQFDADGFPVKAWDPEAEAGLGASSGFDGWYNLEAAKKEFETAVKELKKEGYTVSKENPIVIDLPTYEASTTYINRATAYKQSVENAFDGQVIVNLTMCADAYQWYYAGYYCDYGYQCNYNLYDVSGWGPDYGDPQTYLNTLYGADGDMIHCLGIF